jgi:putative transposase
MTPEAVEDASRAFKKALIERALGGCAERKKVKRPTRERVPLQPASSVHEVWSMDFVSDSLANGRRIKCLTVADDFSHECVDIAVDFGIGGHYVTRVLDQAAIFRGYPRAVRTDNGPEFTSRAFMGWCQVHGIEHLLIDPGKPMQNGYIKTPSRREMHVKARMASRAQPLAGS